MTHPPRIATIIGYLALLLWSTGALAATKVCQLPLLQVLSTIFIFSFFVTAAWLTITRRWQMIRNQPWYVWFIGVSGICIQQFLYIAAFKNGPAIQVDVLILLWPILVIFFSGIFTKEPLMPRHVISGLLGFLSVCLLNCSGDDLGFFTNWHSGYCYAIMCAVLWSLYTICSRHFTKIPLEMIGMYYGIGSILTLPCHLLYENFVMPSFQQWLVLAYMGLFIAGIAYFCWDYGIKKGNIKLLATLSYGNSIISLILLFLFANAQMQDHLGWACFFICTAGIVATDWFGNQMKILNQKIRFLTEYLLKQESKNSWYGNTYSFSETYSFNDGYSFPVISKMSWRPIKAKSKTVNKNFKIRIDTMNRF
jgi:drug/metabolite transporter (DMT)-like permease